MEGARDAKEEFELLVDLLASDVRILEPYPVPGGVDAGVGSLEGSGPGIGVQRGSDGKLDLGRLEAFYERRDKGGGREKGKGSIVDDRSHFGNRSGV